MRLNFIYNFVVFQLCRSFSSNSPEFNVGRHSLWYIVIRGENGVGSSLGHAKTEQAFPQTFLRAPKTGAGWGEAKASNQPPPQMAPGGGQLSLSSEVHTREAGVFSLGWSRHRSS